MVDPSKPPSHANSGSCLKCKLIFDRYPGFYGPLRSWFESFQQSHTEAHISCAGRGKRDQEDAFAKKLTKAHFGESAHSWNAAVDLFVLRENNPDLYDRTWFDSILEPSLTDDLKWYGAPDSQYHELPHVEWKMWRSLVSNGTLRLVK